ncbi:hypothetical protein B0T26DRAFT_677158 [Lasiosphaeria miniovina]|uniref:Fungal N-terminal domain-containing protein n=1 Tax=Lasiosphaeria miniovina TaxID=1954250 RepID=A0AA40ABC0_9PEZI|nr:uncharacterized protein B0T26DRAFT_677158 [Lasiosphaeria miniovina]KAK0712733.1 hypothetical protein B0T26DRAFT_677158 [Lasiosphaeria miniovina]
MDPFSIATVAAGATSQAISISKALYDAHRRYKNAPLAIVTIATKSQLIAASLEKLQSFLLRRDDLSDASGNAPLDLVSVLDTALQGCVVVFSCLEVDLIQKLALKAESGNLLNKERANNDNRALRTESLRAKYPNMRAPPSLFETLPLSTGRSSGSGNTDMSFQFDHQIINTAVYRRFISQRRVSRAKPAAHSSPGDLPPAGLTSRSVTDDSEMQQIPGSNYCLGDPPPLALFTRRKEPAASVSNALPGLKEPQANTKPELRPRLIADPPLLIYDNMGWGKIVQLR